MSPEMRAFLIDLACLLETAGAGLGYTYEDDGVHVTIGNEDVNIGWPDDGKVQEIRDLVDSAE
jgi:hypothetical protein